MKNKNPDGMTYLNKSPIHEIEPEIVDWCQRLSDMVEALTKFELMLLVDDIIRDTPYETRLIEYRKIWY